MSAKKSINKVSFTWAKQGGDFYELKGTTCRYKEGGEKYWYAVLGSLELKPNTGKYFWEIACNGENMRLGVATTDADLNCEMGTGPGIACIDLQNGACLQEKTERKRLWRLVIPVSGSRFGFLYDTDSGTMQFYVNSEFAGTAFNESFGLKGKTVLPCVGIAGVELHNRNIGVGQKRAVVTEEPELYPSVRTAAY